MAEKNGGKQNGRAARATVVRSDSRSRRKVRVAILGVGNCASSLVQGVEYYGDAKPGASIPGLMHVDLGGYHIRDIEFSAAFDIDKDKVGKDLSDAICAGHNHTEKFADVPRRGVKLERTYQLNFGGNTDFLNMLERERLVSKKISKTSSVKSQMKADIGGDNIHIGPSDYVPWLGDRKWAYIRLEGRSFGDVPLNVELKLEVWDSPNSAGVVIDAIRCCKLGLDRKLGGALEGPSSYFMKSPPAQYTDGVAHQLTEAFIADSKVDGKAGVEIPAPEGSTRR